MRLDVMDSHPGKWVFVHSRSDLRGVGGHRMSLHDCLKYAFRRYKDTSVRGDSDTVHVSRLSLSHADAVVLERKFSFDYTATAHNCIIANHQMHDPQCKPSHSLLNVT